MTQRDYAYELSTQNSDTNNNMNPNGDNNNNNNNQDNINATTKTTNHGDEVINIGMNSLRLNVNNHIIGKMRKLSATELNNLRRSNTRSAKYCKVAFYTAITSLSLLFLYLIYQNLFN